MNRKIVYANNYNGQHEDMRVIIIEYIIGWEDPDGGQAEEDRFISKLKQMSNKDLFEKLSNTMAYVYR